jgi:hypothetical protein
MFSSLFQRKSSPSQPQPVVRASAPDPTRPLREGLIRAMADKRYEDANTLLVRLEAMEPKSPRWPHKRGDVLRLLGRNQQAFLAYASAVRLYADEGHGQRARAMAKTAMLGVANLSSLLGQLDGVTQSTFREVCDEALALPVAV